MLISHLVYVELTIINFINIYIYIYVCVCVCVCVSIVDRFTMKAITDKIWITLSFHLLYVNMLFIWNKMAKR